MIAFVSGEPLPLEQWETFYVIVGSAGGALTGLLFVVVALVADRTQAATSRGLSAFTTPSMFHFINVMAIAALVAMPRKGLASLAILLAIVAVIGAVITVLAVVHIHQFDAYSAVAEDWIWHGLIPGVAYALLLVDAIMLRSATDFALYGVGSVSLALLFAGIHNAWDVALYSATAMPKKDSTPSEKS